MLLVLVYVVIALQSTCTAIMTQEHLKVTSRQMTGTSLCFHTITKLRQLPRIGHTGGAAHR